MCYAYGDTHYRSFDGKMIHFQGLCKYELAVPAPGSANDLPNFRVLTKNEERYNDTDVSYTRYVEVITGGYTIRLGRGREVYVSYPISFR